MPARKYPDDLLEEAARLREAGMRISEIGKRLGINPSVVAAYCLQVGADSPDAAMKPPLLQNVPHYTRNGHVVRRFTEAEDARLLALRLRGIGVTEIARRLGRRRNSVIGRLRTLARHEARDEARRETRLLRKGANP